MPETISIDITPTWKALTPVMLAAYPNVMRKLNATECDGRTQDWCTVHDTDYERTGDTACSFMHRASPTERTAWRNDLSAARADLEADFMRMAEAADRYNVQVKEGK